MKWRSSSCGWGLVSVILHWVSALMVIGLFCLGLWMVELGYYHGWYRTAPYIHKSLGVLLFLLTLFRLIWRLSQVAPRPQASHTALERQTAGMVHAMLYFFLFALVFSGYLISTADGRAIEVFNLFEVPAIIQGIERQEDVAGNVHRLLAYILMVLVGIHAAGAIKHHFFDKDETMKRMLR